MSCRSRHRRTLKTRNPGDVDSETIYDLNLTCKSQKCPAYNPEDVASEKYLFEIRLSILPV